MLKSSVIIGIAAAGTVIAGAGLLTRATWVSPVLLRTTLLSLVICTLDWELAWRGVVTDVVIRAPVRRRRRTSRGS
jgi:hypothetical protein